MCQPTLGLAIVGKSLQKSTMLSPCNLPSNPQRPWVLLFYLTQGVLSKPVSVPMICVHLPASQALYGFNNAKRQRRKRITLAPKTTAPTPSASLMPVAENTTAVASLSGTEMMATSFHTLTSLDASYSIDQALLMATMATTLQEPF